MRDCRDLLRCAKCLRVGHFARNCRAKLAATTWKMFGAARFRPQSSKVFVPLSEGFHTRQQQGRRAVTAIMVGPANLGHYPQGMISNDLAGRFIGFLNDFLVAHFRKRDFVIFLPQWVQLEDLVRREGLRLRHCRLRFFIWNPYREAVSARLTYKVWIKLLNLPFEYWTERKVASIVSGFGRYLRADDNSRRLLDINFFLCQVVVEDPADIPENIFLTLGDVIVNVQVLLLSTAPFGGEDRGIPFVGGDLNEGGDQINPMGRQIAKWSNQVGGEADDSVAGAGGDTENNDPWKSSEIMDRWRAVGQAVLSDCRRLRSVGLSLKCSSLDSRAQEVLCDCTLVGAFGGMEDLQGVLGCREEECLGNFSNRASRSGMVECVGRQTGGSYHDEVVLGLGTMWSSGSKAVRGSAEEPEIEPRVVGLLVIGTIRRRAIEGG